MTTLKYAALMNDEIIVPARSQGAAAPATIDDAPSPRKYTQVLNKRVRLRKCGALLRLPADGQNEDIVFTCSKEKHPSEEPHYEKGYVTYDNGTCRLFEMSWIDAGIASFRRARKRQ